MRKLLFITLFCLLHISLPFAKDKEIIWQIGVADNSAAELALGPDNYKMFLEKDFGYEDRYFLIGYSDEKEDFPYVLPGPDDEWGGTGWTAGWRTHEINILFGLKEIPKQGEYKLVVDLVDSHPNRSVVKVTVNSLAKKFDLKGVSDTSIYGDTKDAKERLLEIPLDNTILKEGGNSINIAVLEGAWIVFDQVRLEGSTQLEVIQPEKVFIRDIKPADYEISVKGKNYQPLLVDVKHLSGFPQIEVELDGKNIFTTHLDTARYEFEAPMPAVSSAKRSNYKIFVEGKVFQQGTIQRHPYPLQTPADYVNTKIGTAHSRWMIAPGPWMPFSMVKISPDNQNSGWQAGYQPTIESLGCFSHIHEWTMAGLGTMPTNGALHIKTGDQFDPDSGYRSRIDKSTEEAPLGYYKVYLTDTDIWAEVTATTRCSFQKYIFSQDKDGRVMIDLAIPAEYGYQLLDVDIKKVSDYRIEGKSHQITPTVWDYDADQEYTLHFVMEFDTPIKNAGVWKNGEILNTSFVKGQNLENAGMYVEFDAQEKNTVQVRTGISFVSIENAEENLSEEISKPFGWDFQAIVNNQKKVWNDLLERIDIETNDRQEKIRFYTNMYRSLCRNTFSDVNGEWISADNVKRKFSNPEHLALGCDAFWNTFWNLNQVWNLVTPEWSSKWVNSQLAMYRANEWLAKGPAGMKYVPVMVAEHEIPLIVGAYQMGIRDFDAELAFEAVKKMQTTPAGKVAGGFAGNRDLIPYLEYKYVPMEKGRFSNTLEYSFDDWTVSQFAKSLNKTEDYKVFSERGTWWRNAINPENGYAHLRDTTGKFIENFDPFTSGSNHHYVEGNAWQLSYFVPQDIPALASILGKKAFTDRLEWGFSASEPWRYNAPNDMYWDYPVVQGNQQSMHFSFLFNWVDKPWLTQKWTRSIIDRYYGYGIANAYLGDEDQGQMSAWFVMATIGLFQIDGGCRTEPIYEIASPLYERVTIDLGKRYGRGKEFTIEAKNASRKNKYVQRATLNGKQLNQFWFPASELLKGGSLILEMGDTPNTDWGIGIPNN